VTKKFENKFVIDRYLIHLRFNSFLFSLSPRYFGPLMILKCANYLRAAWGAITRSLAASLGWKKTEAARKISKWILQALWSQS